MPCRVVPVESLDRLRRLDAAVGTFSHDRTIHRLSKERK